MSILRGALLGKAPQGGLLRLGPRAGQNSSGLLIRLTIKVFGEIRGDAAELMAGMSGRANIPPLK